MSGVFEIWEGDPMGSCGCGCVPARITQSQADALVSMMRQRDDAIKRLRGDFPNLAFQRDVVHPQRPRSSYPDHVRELVDLGANPPYFFLNKKLIHSSSFPAYDELKTLLGKSL